MKIRIAAKTDVGLERTNNEDNFQLAQDLTQPVMQWNNAQSFDVGPKGTLLVVADGMGGMEAGEVASAIAIETIKQCFAPDKITDEVLKNRYSIERFMKNAIQQADIEIKRAGKNKPGRGMGTTIVIGWIINGNLYVSWCGDSRAYIYNPAQGLKQISKDHSYVQTLVDKGVITHEEAFDYPDSNIITRSLCDKGPKAMPDCLVGPLPLSDKDMVLLCSDGLSGMLRDNEMDEIITAHQEDAEDCVNALIEGALRAGGADNVTVALAVVEEGGVPLSPNRLDNVTHEAAKPLVKDLGGGGSKKGRKNLWMIIGIIAILAVAAGAFFLVQSLNSGNDAEDEIEQPKETTTPPATPNTIEENIQDNQIDEAGEPSKDKENPTNGRQNKPKPPTTPPTGGGNAGGINKQEIGEIQEIIGGGKDDPELNEIPENPEDKAPFAAPNSINLHPGKGNQGGSPQGSGAPGRGGNQGGSNAGGGGNPGGANPGGGNLGTGVLGSGLQGCGFVM